MDPTVVLKGVLPPIGAALLLVTLAGARLLPLAAAAGLLVAYGLLKAWPAPPHVLWSSPNGVEWLLWAVAAAAVVSVLEHVRLLRGGTALLASLALAPASVWLVLQKVAGGWSAADAWLQVAGGGAAVALAVAGHRVVLARAPAGWFPAAIFAVVLSVDAIVLTLGRSALLGQLCGAVAAALGAGIGTALWRRSFTLATADGTWLGIAHGLFVLAGVHLAMVPWPAAGALLVAPPAMLLLRSGLGQARPMAWAVGAAVLASIPLAGAVWFVLAASDG